MLLTWSIVFAVAYLAIVATLAIAAALRAGGRREDAGDDHDALAASRFTIPVSIIVPVSNTTTRIGPFVSALLGLNYPEFEVIVVADGQTDAVEALRPDWQLEAREFFYRKTIETSEVRRIYRSDRDHRLMVIDKAAAGYSDAVNCGVNVARYRYFMPVGPELRFDRDALLRVMTAALRDPANVVGASSHVERSADVAEERRPSVAGPRPTAVASAESLSATRRENVERAGLTALFQRLASARSLMESRLAWRYLRAGLGPTGGVTVWRRDAVIKINGFSATAADPDLDMMFRLQKRGADGGGRFDRGVDVFGHVDPQSMRGALRMAGRRQRAAFEILAASLAGRGGGLDPRTLAYFTATEILTPIAQAWVVVATALGAVAGWLPWTSVIVALVLLSFGNGAVSAAALLLRGSAAGAPEEPELRRLLAAGPMEFMLYRPALAAARFAAALSFVIPGR